MGEIGSGGGGEKANGSNPTWEQIDSQIFSAISFFPQLISSGIFFFRAELGSFGSLLFSEHVCT